MRALTLDEIEELSESGHFSGIDTGRRAHVPARCEMCLLNAGVACPENGLACPGCRFCPAPPPEILPAAFRKRRPDRYRPHKKPHCEDCGWVADHACQLDVDHIDGNRANNDPANLRTLCANCHRLKTARERGLAPPTKV